MDNRMPLRQNVGRLLSDLSRYMNRPLNGRPHNDVMGATYTVSEGMKLLQEYANENNYHPVTVVNAGDLVKALRSDQDASARLDALVAGISDDRILVSLPQSRSGASIKNPLYWSLAELNLSDAGFPEVVHYFDSCPEIPDEVFEERCKVLLGPLVSRLRQNRPDIVATDFNWSREEIEQDATNVAESAAGVLQLASGVFMPEESTREMLGLDADPFNLRGIQVRDYHTENAPFPSQAEQEFRTLAFRTPLPPLGPIHPQAWLNDNQVGRRMDDLQDYLGQIRGDLADQVRFVRPQSVRQMTATTRAGDAVVSHVVSTDPKWIFLPIDIGAQDPSGRVPGRHWTLLIAERRPELDPAPTPGQGFELPAYQFTHFDSLPEPAAGSMEVALIVARKLAGEGAQVNQGPARKQVTRQQSGDHALATAEYQMFKIARTGNGNPDPDMTEANIAQPVRIYM